MKNLQCVINVRAVIAILIILLAIFRFSVMHANTTMQDSDRGIYCVMPVKPTERTIQIALLLDTSNSMDGLIEQAKAQLWKTVNEMALARDENGLTPNLEIALYEYGNDRLNGAEGHIRLVEELTTDLDAISESLFSLTTNGGNEYCGWVIKDAVEDLQWSKSNDELKMIFIAGNEPFTQGKMDYKTYCKKAIENGIVVNTIFCGNYQEGVNTNWKDGADMTDGKYLNIDQNREVVYIESPYDEEIQRLNGELNKTYVGYGSMGFANVARQAAQDDNASKMSGAMATERAVSKSSSNYKNTSWDLVDAFEEDETVIEELEADDLPKELRGKSDKEIKEYILVKKEKREKLKEEIQFFNKKRMEHIAKVQEENTEELTLDKVMLETIRKQAESKNYQFEN